MCINFNGTINVYGNVYFGAKSTEEEVSEAKDKFVELLYKKRDKKSWASREMWTELLEDYRCNRYWECYRKIAALPTTQTKSKDKALGYLETIINAGNMANNL